MDCMSSIYHLIKSKRLPAGRFNISRYIKSGTYIGERRSERDGDSVKSWKLVSVRQTWVVQLLPNYSNITFHVFVFLFPASFSLRLCSSSFPLTVKCLYAHQCTQDLRRLNLAENLIVELVPRVFYMLGKLKYLTLSGNPLNDLPPDVFKDILVSEPNAFHSIYFVALI